MSEFTIFHNPRCSKSRQTLQLLQANGIEPEIVEYLNEAMDKKQLESVFSALGKRPKDVLRSKEDEYKALNIDFDNDEAVIEAIIAHPKILERPIVVKDNKEAVLGRPPENIFELL